MRSRSRVSLLLLASPALAGIALSQVPAGNGTSDSNLNTGGGTGALGGPASSNPGYANAAYGYATLVVNTGQSNAAFGYSALRDNTTGGGNTASGFTALYANTTGQYNTATGSGALTANQTPSYNTAVGARALYFNDYSHAGSASENTAVGFDALQSNLTASANTAVGYQALYTNDSQGAGSANENTAIGSQALFSNTTGGDNSACGTGALNLNSSGGSNSAMGAYSNVNNTTGNYNSSLGFNALAQGTTGSYNTGLGADAAYSNTTGNYNIAVGYQAGFKVTGSNNIDIGSEGDVADQASIRIGTKGTHKETFIAGIYTTSQLASSLPVYVNSLGRLSAGTSSERYKTAIKTMGAGSAKLGELRPVSFHLKTDPNGAVQYGLIAEEVAKVYPELVVRDENRQIQGVRYDELAPMLLNEVQHQATQLAEQKAELAELRRINESLQEAVNRLLVKDERVASR